MRRAVFCWELGGNYGHITSFLPFYNELKKRGVEVSFILKDVRFAEEILGVAKECYWQAPGLKNDSCLVSTTYTYVDLLAQIGYIDAGYLSAYIKEWRDLLMRLDADIIVANHAPSALLAARTLGMPATVFGSGFLIPPLADPLPLFSVWDGVANEIARRNDEAVKASINTVLTSYGCSSMERLCDLLNVHERFLCTLPELDHYINRTDEDYWGPYFVNNIGTVPEWPDGCGPRIFAYLTPQVKSLHHLLNELSSVSGSKLIHIPYASEELVRHYGKLDLRIEKAPVNMQSVLSCAELVIHQGGIGTTSACLLAGIRQILIPTQLEQQMSAKKVISLGLAYGVNPEGVQPSYKDTILHALACPILGKNLMLFRKKYFGFDQAEQYSAMADVVLAVIEDKV